MGTRPDTPTLDANFDDNDQPATQELISTQEIAQDFFGYDGSTLRTQNVSSVLTRSSVLGMEEAPAQYPPLGNDVMLNPAAHNILVCLRDVTRSLLQRRAFGRLPLLRQNVLRHSYH
jgi:hypothetical protein